jgi:hypothetical protein
MEKFYKEYGKFIIHFENVCFTMNYCIRHICTKGKMFSSEDKNIEILLQGLTAQPILTKFKAIFFNSEHFKNNEFLELFNIFNNNFIKVIEFRNFIAHGTFFYGDPYGNIDKFQIRNTKINKKGFYDNTNIIDISSLENLNKDIVKLENFLGYLSIYIRRTSKESKIKIYNLMKQTIINLTIDLNIESKSIQI